MSEHAAGWFNDPYGRYQQRYWTGSAWSEHVATNGVQQVDPMGTSAVIPIVTPATAYESPEVPAADPAVQSFAATADPGDPNAQSDDPEAPAPSNAITRFLDGMGPDAKLRPRPSLRAAVAGLGGVVMAVGALVAVLGDNPSRGKLITASLVLAIAAWAARMFVKLSEVQAAAVGMVVVAIPVLATATTVDNGTGGFLTGLIGAALFLAAWALPGFKSRNLLLGLGTLLLVGALGSLSSSDQGDIDRCNSYLEEGDYDRFDAECQNVYDDSGNSFLPVEVTDNVGTQGSIYLFSAAVLLGGTWWLDRRNYRGTSTGLCAAGLVAALIGTVLLADEFGDTMGPLFVLVVGLLICVVGTHGARRATTWWGALLTAIGVVSFVAVQWKPSSTGAVGGVAIVAGLVLVGIPLVAAPIRVAIAQNRAGGPPQVPPSSGLAPPTQ